jgi:hypothetical protein
VPRDNIFSPFFARGPWLDLKGFSASIAIRWELSSSEKRTLVAGAMVTKLKAEKASRGVLQSLELETILG